MVPILVKEDFKRSVLKRLVYSVGKDSACMLPLLKKAFYPSLPARESEAKAGSPR